MWKIILLITGIIGLTGCQRAHLEIFPDLKSPDLIEVKLTPEQMSADVDALIAGAMLRHPDLAKYTDIDALYDFADSLKAGMTHPMTRVEFFHHIGKLNAQFADGHAFLIWPYQEFNKLKEQGAKPFPFAVKLTKNNKLAIAENYQYQQTKVEAGQVISSINGVKVDDMLSNLQHYVGGETKRLREHIVAQRFPIMLWSVYGYIDDFEVQLQEQALMLSASQQWQTSQINKEEHYYTKLNKEVGYLYLGHFDIEPSEFETFIDATFAQLKTDRVSKLVIDIRDNPGGNTDTVSYLTSYIADKPFRLVSSLQEKLNHQNRGWFNYKGEVGEMLTEQWDDWEQPIDSENRFSGDVFLLIGPITYSAAIVLATGLQDHNFATLVGEETGGFANQTAQGNLFNLPNSQLRAYITTRLLVRPNGSIERAPVIPDIKVEVTAESLIDSGDAALEYILAN